MDRVTLIVVSVVGIALFVLVVLAILLDFSDMTGWKIPRLMLDWWALFFGLLAIGGFGGLAFVIWS